MMGRIHGLVMWSMLLCATTTFADGGVIRFHVVDEAGNAIPGAQVSWKPYKPGLAQYYPIADERGVTDEKGDLEVDFRLHPDYEYNNFSVRIEVPGELIWFQRVYPKKGSESSMTITLLRGDRIQGVVRDATGDSLEGVMVGTGVFPLAVTDGRGRYELHLVEQWLGDIFYFKEGYGWLKQNPFIGEMNHYCPKQLFIM